MLCSSLVLVSGEEQAPAWCPVCLSLVVSSRPDPVFLECPVCDALISVTEQLWLAVDVGGGEFLLALPNPPAPVSFDHYD